MYIEEVVKQLPGKLAAIEAQNAEILRLLSSQPQQKGEALLTSHQILKRLGLRPTQKAWVPIRKLLITKYGMSKKAGTGYRIPEKNFIRFMDEEYKSKS